MQIDVLNRNISVPIQPDTTLPTVAILPLKRERKNAVTSRKVDFWMMGGASLVIWAVMLVAGIFRQSIQVLDQHFLQLTATFGILSLVCNYPHFIMSYRIGYSKGLKFIFKYWFSLVVVPLLFIGAYSFAYFNFSSRYSEASWIHGINSFLETLSVSFRLGTLSNRGTEILSLSVWVMYLTVGWHYSKQVFGCMIVYSKYDGYVMSVFQRRLIKFSVFSVALFNFFYLSSFIDQNSYNMINRFLGVPMISLGLPAPLLLISGGMVVLSFFMVCYFVFYGNFRRTRSLPSRNFLIPWIAFHVWWIPLMSQPEFYILVVPFFHSLQYLPFAYNIETKGSAPGNIHVPKLVGRILLLLMVSFLTFELIPSSLDQQLNTAENQIPWFFAVAFIVFINVHHFFIDSVIWRLNEPKTRASLF